MLTLGINATFHDCAATLVRDGAVVAAAEEERFTRVKHGKRPLGFFLLRQSRSAATLRNAAELMVTSAVLPLLSVWWRLVGIGRFGARLP